MDAECDGPNSLLPHRNLLAQAALSAQRRKMPDSNSMVLFNIGGEARLTGADSENPTSHAKYKVPRRSAFDGQWPPIVQSTQKAGPIRITTSSPGLSTGTVTLTSHA